MDLLKHVKPKDIRLDKPSLISKTSPSVINLDSGVVDKIEEDLPIKHNIDSTNAKSFSIFDIYSFCNLYLQYDSEFVQLKHINKDYINKFSSEVEILNRDIRNNQINAQLLYLDKTYSKYNFEFDINVMQLSSTTITIKDSLYFKDDYVIIPTAYDNIIDFVINTIKLEIKEIRFVDISMNSRKVKVTPMFNILHENKSFCKICEFQSICDVYHQKFKKGYV